MCVNLVQVERVATIFVGTYPLTSNSHIVQTFRNCFKPQPYSHLGAYNSNFVCIVTWIRRWEVELRELFSSPRSIEFHSEHASNNVRSCTQIRIFICSRIHQPASTPPIMIQMFIKCETKCVVCTPFVLHSSVPSHMHISLTISVIRNCSWHNISVRVNIQIHVLLYCILPQDNNNIMYKQDSRQQQQQQRYHGRMRWSVEEKTNLYWEYIFVGV